MPPRSKKQTRSTGVTLEVPVMDYVTEMAVRDERTRSYVLNRIVREHAERSGTPLPTAYEPSPDTTGRPCP